MNAAILILATTPVAAFLPERLADSWLELLAALGATILAGIGLWQYVYAQRWQRAQFLAAEVSNYRSDPLVRRAFTMLDDYEARAIDLFPEEQDASKRTIDITTEMVSCALAEEDAYGTPEARICDAIRDCFDQFFDGLERFECFIRAGLITKTQLEPFLGYWIKQIADTKGSRKGSRVIEAARHYIEKYYFGEVQVLCGRFGYGFPSVRP